MKKTILGLFSVGVVILSLTGCSSVSDVVSKVTRQVERNVLTNLSGANGKILMVKIDDTPDANPQIGLSKADVVYIEQVEGGLTRLAAIYSDPTRLPPLIGPVRSARISDVDIAAGLGRVAFAFSGMQTKMRPVIASANLVNLSAEREPSSIYSRDLSRREPTNLILHPKLLLEKATQEGASIDSVKSIGHTFGSAPEGGKIIQSIFCFLVQY